MATHRFLVRFAMAPDAGERAPDLEEAEKAYILEVCRAGGAVSVGRFKDFSRGALGLFDSREAAEAFIAEDPFCVHGVIASWRIDEFNEVASAGPSS